MTDVIKQSEASRGDSDKRVQTDSVLFDGRGSVIRVSASVPA